MAQQEKIEITVIATINAPVAKAWKTWTNPVDVMQWNNASDDWHTSHAENDLRAGGKFLYRMEAKDGSFGFDFEGRYDIVLEHELIEYRLADERKVKISFFKDGNSTRVTESFEAETENSIELQQAGWQAILNNFKKYTEQAE